MNYLVGSIAIASLIHVADRILIFEYMDSSLFTLLCTFILFAAFLAVFGGIVFNFYHEIELSVKFKVLTLWVIVFASYLAELSFNYSGLGLLTWYDGLSSFNKAVFLIKVIIFPVYVSLLFFDIWSILAGQQVLIQKQKREIEESTQLIQDHINKLNSVEEEEIITIPDSVPLLQKQVEQDNKKTKIQELSQNPEYDTESLFPKLEINYNYTGK